LVVLFVLGKICDIIVLMKMRKGPRGLFFMPVFG
jgi:hypothetical protein